jgi:glycosyltransferase involved in cell wall biosynthesis
LTITLRHELLLLLGLSCLLILAIYLLPIPAMRVALGGAYVVFFPGYTLVAALFPGRRQLDAVERLRLSFGLSMAVMPLIGLVLKMVGTGRRLAQ